MAGTCPRCGCATPDDDGAHAIQAALLQDDLDAAIEAGLLDARACSGCDAACNAALDAARGARRDALAARERFRARESRLQRCKAERGATRRAPPRDGNATASPGGLPPAAADALARALAKARERRQ